MNLKHLSKVNKLKNGFLFHTKWNTLKLGLLLFVSLFICISSIAEENLYPPSNYVLELLEKERKNNVCILLLCKLKCAYKRNDKTNKQAAILGLQPRDKAAMLGVKTKEYFLEEFT